MTLQDLRRPEREETALSREEVAIGLRDGTIPWGPWSARMASPMFSEFPPVAENPAMEGRHAHLSH